MTNDERCLSPERFVDALNAAVNLSGRVVIQSGRLKFDGDDDVTTGWYVQGGGLAGGTERNPIDAFARWMYGLVKASELDPEHFNRFQELREHLAEVLPCGCEASAGTTPSGKPIGIFTGTCKVWCWDHGWQAVSTAQYDEIGNLFGGYA